MADIQQAEQRTTEESGQRAGYPSITIITTSTMSAQGSDTSATSDVSEAQWTIDNSQIQFARVQLQHWPPLTLAITQGHPTLIFGPRQQHKRNALVRLLLGRQALLLGGHLCSPQPHTGIMHVAARPYIKAGSSSLWDLLIFPHDKTQCTRRGIGERHLGAILRFMDFEFLLQRASDDWGHVVDWIKVLGPAELYAVSICRLLYHSPRFAIVDETLDFLQPDQVRQLFVAARMHRVTLLALAESNPFDKETAHGACVACLSEFTRVLRVSRDAWEFGAVGSAQQQGPVFGAEEPEWLWATAEDEVQRCPGRLLRRTSTLSQCSTTERRWRTGDSLGSRRQSYVISPSLTARSSFSDFSAIDQSSTFGSGTARMLAIDNALAKYASTVTRTATRRQPLLAASEIFATEIITSKPADDADSNANNEVDMDDIEDIDDISEISEIDENASVVEDIDEVESGQGNGINDMEEINVEVNARVEEKEEVIEEIEEVESKGKVIEVIEVIEAIKVIEKIKEEELVEVTEKEANNAEQENIKEVYSPVSATTLVDGAAPSMLEKIRPESPVNFALPTANKYQRSSRPRRDSLHRSGTETLVSSPQHSGTARKSFSRYSTADMSLSSAVAGMTLSGRSSRNSSGEPRTYSRSPSIIGRVVGRDESDYM
ncbi:ATP-binding cassette sub- D member 1 [Kickxella alabastrina]|uniref:ATP-binding cassette sub- D member 1 n=1 Tax=Kickxella alabastrina TaxID=61397 RepID=A0ACC1I3R1_9FUNG|nr:ATP-binding cassette sub- D member 1 [Kickxella alabastrina]